VAYARERLGHGHEHRRALERALGRLLLAAVDRVAPVAPPDALGGVEASISGLPQQRQRGAPPSVSQLGQPLRVARQPARMAARLSRPLVPSTTAATARA
jgi:hypothetical protein